MRLARRWFPYIYLFFWLAIFFPRWYALTFTKVWELKRAALRDRQEQMQVIFPSREMQSLLDLRQSLTDDPRVTYILSGPAVAALPIARNGGIVRALFYPYRAGVAAGIDERVKRVTVLMPEKSFPECPALDLTVKAEINCFWVNQ